MFLLKNRTLQHLLIHSDVSRSKVMAIQSSLLEVHFSYIFVFFTRARGNIFSFVWQDLKHRTDDHSKVSLSWLRDHAANKIKIYIQYYDNLSRGSLFPQFFFLFMWSLSSNSAHMSITLQLVTFWKDTFQCGKKALY